MATQFTPCPACGAVGEVGSNCQFCGTTIILKEGATFSDARIIKQRTITPQQYAEKISIYHNIEGLCDGVSKVSIGEQEGIVNLNGDLIYPLGNERVSNGFQDGIVRIGKKFLNLESFEYVEDPYLNQTLLEKIKKLSEVIINNPQTDAKIWIGWGALDVGYERIGFIICNAYTIYNPHNNPDYQPDFEPGLMLSTNFEAYSDTLSNMYEKTKCYNSFTSCEDFKSFKTINEYVDGAVTPPIGRDYYILFGNDAENCCRTTLKVLNQMYGIYPDDILNDIECEITDEKPPVQSFSNPSSTPSSNSGCAGMLALMLGIGGASVYGIVELISRLIA